MVENASSTLGSARSRRSPAQHASLGSAPANPLGDLQALAQVNHRLAGALRALFEPLLRQDIRVSADPIAVEGFADYLSGRGPVAGLTSVSLIGMAPLSGEAMLVLDGGLTLKLVDLYFGGTGVAPSPLPTEFTPTAEAMIARIAAGFADRLAGAWSELADIGFTLGRTHADPSLLTNIEGADAVVRTRFVVTPTHGMGFAVDLLYPAATLKPIATILSARSQPRAEAGNPTWQGALARSVMQVKLPVRSVLAEPVIPLRQLMALKPGDIIPISFGPEIPLLVANRRFARGAVGASNGRAAIRVHRIEPIEDEDSQ